jgi:GNAT superfamily N-acetyltransferase
MKARFRDYQHSDFLRVRDFLVASNARHGSPVNWCVDRWNFVSALGRVMNGLSPEAWRRGIGLWEDEAGAIVAMANEEEGKGDVFFQAAGPGVLDRPLLKEMFAFAEERCLRRRGKARGFRLRVPDGEALLASMVEERGYTRHEWQETAAALDLGADGGGAPVAAGLPEGLRLVDGHGLEPAAKALAHARAFGYLDEKAFRRRAVKGFCLVPGLPDYRAELDLAAVDRDGGIASFCTLWLDGINCWAVLEPVGTVPEWRRRGLGEALIAEGTRRVRELGARRVLVFSGQEFYRAIGFRAIASQAVWEHLQKPGGAIR